MNRVFATIGIIAFTAGIVLSQNNSDRNDIRFDEVELSSPTSIDSARQKYNSGYRAFHKGDYKTAISMYKEAISIDPEYSDAYDNCGLSFRRMGQLDSAKYYYKKSIGINPNGTIAHGNLAIVYGDQGHLDSALYEYKKIKQINPEDPESYYGSANVYFLMENYDKALENSLQAMILFEKYKPLYLGDAEFYVGLAYYHKGNKEKAKTYMRKAYLNGRIIPGEYISELGIK